MGKIGFYIKKTNTELHPSNPKDFVSNWSIIAPSIDACMEECIEIDNKYVLSIGAYSPLSISLFSVSENINYWESLKISDMISYLFDAVVYTGSSEKKEQSNKYNNELKSYYAFQGHHFTDLFTLESNIADNYDLLDSVVGDMHSRMLTKKKIGKGKSFSLDMPNDDKLERALAAYKQGLLSYEPYGKILNYWRVLEAITTIENREDLFGNYGKIRLIPVYALKISPNYETFNLITKYKKYIRPYYKTLLDIHGNSANLARFFYKNRRCEIAHNKTSSLKETDDISLASLLNDALLLKIIARCAIEDFWRKIDCEI